MSAYLDAVKISVLASDGRAAAARARAAGVGATKKVGEYSPTSSIIIDKHHTLASIGVTYTFIIHHLTGAYFSVLFR